MTDDAFKAAKKHARAGAEKSLEKLIADAKALIDHMIGAGTPAPQFLGAGVVSAGVLLHEHDAVRYAELIAHLRKGKVLRIWDQKIKEALKTLAKSRAAAANMQDDVDAVLADMIAWFRATYPPRFYGEDHAIDCGDLGRIKEPQLRPDNLIIDKIMVRLGVDRLEANDVFKNLRGNLWGELRRSLPHESTTTAGMETWTAVVEALLASLVFYRLNGTATERAYAVGSLARWYADRNKNWTQVPGLPLWTRTNEAGFWIALWPGLTTKTTRPIAILQFMTKTLFTQRCIANGLAPQPEVMRNLITVNGKVFAATILLPPALAEMQIPSIDELEDPLRDASPETRETLKTMAEQGSKRKYRH